MLHNYPWQQQQWQHLCSRWQRQQLPHAVLLSGALGLGQYEFARAFAGLLLCEESSKSTSACGQCASCQLFLAGSHPDYYEVIPTEKSLSIKIDQVRELIDELGKTAHYGGYQVAIINPAEAMNTRAANALLKTLEEPSGQVVLFLVNHQTYNLPATIISRCQKLIFKTHPLNIIRDWLIEQLNTETSIDLWLKFAENAPLRALDFAKNNFLAIRDVLLQQLLQISKQQMTPIAGVADLLKFDLHELLYIFALCVSDISRLQLGASPENIMNIDRVPQLQALADHGDRVKIQRFLAQLPLVKQQLSKVTSLNPQLLLEDLLVSFGEIYVS